MTNLFFGRKTAPLHKNRPARRSSKRQKRLTGTWLEALAGQLADPTDLEFDEDHLDDPDALAAAVDDLLARKPHLASRRADR
jgi:hypothetical protein